MNKAIFLDRDGTINIEVDYLHHSEKFVFEDTVLETLSKCKQLGYLLIVVSNQSGVGRGYYSEDDVNSLHRHVNEMTKEYGFSFDDFYFCPHHPEKALGKYKIDCDCRKPKPGMIIEAVKKFSIDLEKSYMIGDKKSDIEAGKAVGMKTILVGSGYGEKTKENYNNYDFYAEKLVDILEFIEK
ncbi:MAG: D-glycero-beta-D-manno-heptose 1,7-bisphosphate 7-phosphatase [Candidatus Delongbacteria bacterium]|nr:D-glycero-beta-D-manno-heptose 1,7-bisphosphate 7-phosphatase [Candidatus Delongbacteria bacterium]MBN2833958.1 D-glycero-beta-D-manno-heptose 1,7-bisphosphate 7-phosphatase [Candidatus Delongbacteria bacterium]